MKDESCLARAAQVGKGFIREWFEGQLDRGYWTRRPLLTWSWRPSSRGFRSQEEKAAWTSMSPMTGRSACFMRAFGLRHEDVGWPRSGRHPVPGRWGKIKVMYNSHETSFKMVNGRRSQAVWTTHKYVDFSTLLIAPGGRPRAVEERLESILAWILAPSGRQFPRPGHQAEKQAERWALGNLMPICNEGFWRTMEGGAIRGAR